MGGPECLSSGADRVCRHSRANRAAPPASPRLGSERWPRAGSARGIHGQLQRAGPQPLPGSPPAPSQLTSPPAQAAGIPSAGEITHCTWKYATFFFFSLCCTAVLTKIRTCRMMPLVSRSSEKNAAMPVSSQQGENLLEEAGDTLPARTAPQKHPPTPSPFPTTTHSPACPCCRTEAQPLQL